MTGRVGTVYLVGAGPGDPGLLTRRAARLLRRAEVVIHDALVTAEILDVVPAGVERIDVGKRCRGKQTPQAEIHRLMIEAAKRARVVVRLKGGDPFVFGRGGEEALALREARVPFRIVPGVTAGTGVLAYAGIPVTHRGLASSVTFVTGHEKPAGGADAVDWEALSRVGGTLVIYMGVFALPTVVEKLLAGGRSPSTPAAVVEWGTVRQQRTITGTLAELPELAQTAGITSPALVAVGEVVRLQEELAWFEPRTIRGLRVLVGRSRPQPSRLAKSLRRLGASVSEYPALRAVPATDARALTNALAQLSTYDWVVFNSTTAVSRFLEELQRSGRDAPALAGLRIACAGTATGTALREAGIRAEVVTRTFDADEVAAAFEAHGGAASSPVLFPREEGGPSPLTEALARRGACVDEVPAYRIELERDNREDVRRLLAQGSYDAVVLSSSTVARHVASTVGDVIGSARVIAIGPETARVALSCGLSVHTVPEVSSLAGITRALFELVDETRGPFSHADSGPRPGRPRLSAEHGS